VNTACVVVGVTTVLAAALHPGLYWKIRGWMDRDLALRLAASTRPDVRTCWSAWSKPGASA
jgi:hypothetical protein